jgi:sugar O-acyltransferase (sialic acid O-acetyltransferase NeuD family)
MHLVGVYGASGCGVVVMSFLRREAALPGSSFVFIDDNCHNDVINGVPVMSFAAFVESRAERKSFTVAVASSVLRQKLTEKCLAHGLDWFEHLSQRAFVMDGATFGPGMILSPFATLGSNCQVGKGFLGDIYSCANHDCEVGDWVTLAPYANVNGAVQIGDHAYIGSGALIKQGRPGRPLAIGKGAVIGMGAVVTRDVPAGVTVVGNPARILIRD